MASENRQVVGEITCNPRYLGLVQPEKELPNTRFLMDFNIKMMRCAQSADDLEGDEEITQEISLSLVDLDYNPHSMWIAINEELQDLQIPSQVRAAVEDSILKGTRAARAGSSFHARKYLHVEVDIVFRVGGFDGIGTYEPRFVPASEASIKKLEKTRAEVSTVCAVCMEEIMAGSEAARMPCSHLYHDSCIVKWLRKSGVCPLCKFCMPFDK